jgi:hypothetical protein
MFICASGLSAATRSLASNSSCAGECSTRWFGQRLDRHGGEGACGLDAHEPRLVVQEPRGVKAIARMQAIEGKQRRGAHERIGVDRRRTVRLRRDLRWRQGQQRESGRARDRGRCAVCRDGCEQRIRSRLLLTSRGDGESGVGIIASARPEPVHDLPRRPGLRLVRMAGRAGVGRVDLCCDIRARDAEGVIASPVDAHVGHGRHVAGRKLRALAARAMVMMRGNIEACGEVALRADHVALRPQRATMRLVAIGTDHARLAHARLRERAPLEDLAPDLAVGMVLPALEQQRRVGVEEPRRRRDGGCGRGRGRMSRPARRWTGAAALPGARCRADRPRRSARRDQNDP